MEKKHIRALQQAYKYIKGIVYYLLYKKKKKKTTTEINNLIKFN